MTVLVAVRQICENAGGDASTAAGAGGATAAVDDVAAVSATAVSFANRV